MANSNPKAAIVVGGATFVMMIVGAAGYWLMAPQPEPQRAARAEVPPQVATPKLDDRAGERATVPDDGPRGEAPSRAPGSESAQLSPAQRMKRDLERERIWQALRQAHALEPETPGAAVPTPEQRAKLPQLDPQYIQEAIREQLVPVAVECYESALEDEPELAGQLLVEFTIVGAEEVGGIVEDALIQDDSTLDNAFVRECIRESVMAVSFEPPEAGGEIKVVYPINFEPE